MTKLATAIAVILCKFLMTAIQTFGNVLFLTNRVSQKTLKPAIEI
jgi:hypothetical protein